MFRKSAVLAAGGYRHFPLFEDYYLWIRMLMNGAKFYNIQESLLYFRFLRKCLKKRRMEIYDKRIAFSANDETNAFYFFFSIHAKPICPFLY